MTPFAFGLILVGVLLNAAAQFFLKMATNSLGVLHINHFFSFQNLGHMLTQWPLLVGLCSYGLSLVIWLMALSRTDVTLAYPMLAIGYIINALAAQAFLGEIVSVQRWLATAIIFIGVVLLARS